MTLDTQQTPEPARFGILDTIEGCEVIDEQTGHPVAWAVDRRSANGKAQHLNSAMLNGRKALTRALGAVGD